MNNILVRLLSIELFDFKNVKHGLIAMPNEVSNEFISNKSEILGIYGQNGSGKTAVVDALAFLKNLMMGLPLPIDAANYISVTKETASLRFRFYMKNQEHEFLVSYDFTLGRLDDNKAKVVAEKIAFSVIDNNVKTPEVTLIKYNGTQTTTFSPKYRFDQINKGNKETNIKIGVAKTLATLQSKSFVFCSEFRELWDNNNNLNNDWVLVLKTLQHYAITNLFTVKNGHSRALNVNFDMAINFKHEDEFGSGFAGDVLVSLREPNVFSKPQFEVFEVILTNASHVMGMLVPGFAVEAISLGSQFLQSGEAGIRFELVSKRGDSVIPLCYESEGIKKLLCVINHLIAIYNNPSMCVAVDELDAGVYEYLLGELLSVIDETGKGQLIFTSHNLRPLEMLNKTSILFTTTNPDNRYIRLPNVKTTNNLRDMYLRSINVGGQKEQIYEPTKEHEIRRAFRKAGGMLNG